MARWVADAQIHADPLVFFTSQAKTLLSSLVPFNKDFAEQINRLAAEGTPFLFVIDFEMQKPFVCRLEDAARENIFYDVAGKSNVERADDRTSIELECWPPSFEEYESRFSYVADRLRYGDSFLTNLTVRSTVTTNRNIEELFHVAQAKYKLLFRDEFLVFSPETFIQIENGKIVTNPMKGTINADIKDAAEKLLGDPKELAEHVTIVDLLRNDLSLVSDHVEVTRFRYLDPIKTTKKTLLQMSSEISGRLSAGYRSRIGDILLKLLPAGSVSGAPKQRTLEIIREAEGALRGYYTGVFGIFDGGKLDSGVMIRYIENDNGKLYYHSGGGITAQSDVRAEYQELIDKIYVPVD